MTVTTLWGRSDQCRWPYTLVRPLRHDAAGIIISAINWMPTDARIILLFLLYQTYMDNHVVAEQISEHVDVWSAADVSA